MFSYAYEFRSELEIVFGNYRCTGTSDEAGQATGLELEGGVTEGKRGAPGAAQSGDYPALVRS
jgi:hypothetical protein